MEEKKFKFTTGAEASAQVLQARVNACDVIADYQRKVFEDAIKAAIENGKSSDYPIHVKAKVDNTKVDDTKDDSINPEAPKQVMTKLEHVSKVVLEELRAAGWGVRGNDDGLEVFLNGDQPLYANLKDMRAKYYNG